jgi:hypothetical protein
MGGRTTLSAGIRYDLEVIPLNEDFNPLFPAGNKQYPVDRNNFAPRIGLTHALDSSGRTVVRGGYGLFYNRTVLGSIDDVIEQGKFISSATVSFPNDSADPGPAAGRLPTDPFLVNGPFVNTTLLRQLYPAGVATKSNGVIVFDSPDRRQPYAHQATVGFGHELRSALAIQADYIHMQNKDMFLARNLNPMVRANTTRTGLITRSDAFGVLGGETYAQQVWVMENNGESKYDALNLSLEKRYANNWSGRISYSLSKSRGTAYEQADKNTYQFQTDLNLDEFYGPTPVDRRHVLSINGRTEIPRTHGITVSSTLRYMSGAPFTILDSSIDANRNGELVDPLPAGTYSGNPGVRNVMTDVENKGGRNGAIGPDYFQLDLRAGWRGHLGGSRALELFLDIFNITNRTNWDNPTVAGVPGAATDRRLTATFMQLTNLRGGSGFPRQAVFGTRLMF